MFVNRTYDSMNDQYARSNRSNRTQLKIDKKKIFVSSSVLDKIADDKLYGGYNNKRNREVCTGCFVRKSVNGSCNC